MYINYNGTKYPCRCRPGATMTYHRLPDNFPAPVSGEIVLCADDGFILRTDVVEKYLRQSFADGVLVLTNVPEPESEPELDIPVDDSNVWDELDTAYQEGVNTAYDE